jgi:hypothetical protein
MLFYLSSELPASSPHSFMYIPIHSPSDSMSNVPTTDSPSDPELSLGALGSRRLGLLR